MTWCNTDLLPVELKHGLRLAGLKCIHSGLDAHLNTVCRKQWHGYVKHHLVGCSDAY